MMVRFSYGLLGAYPAGEMVDLIRTADELGFHACHLADDPSARDCWSVAAAAARETTSIRLGFSATHVYLREPTLIAQALATLDELSHGRAEAVVSFGDPHMLDAYHVAWRGQRPLARVREALQVMRVYLDEGAVEHDGEFFHYTGVETAVRPVQEHLPLLVGALGGPRSFEMAGEVADGVECASTSRENSQYVVEHVRRGAERAGRNPDALQMGAYCVTAVADNSAAAKEAARAVVAGWLPSYPDSLIARHGIDPDEVAPIVAAFAQGNVDEALRRTTPAIGEAFTVAGTPEECAERIRTDLVEPGIDHILLAVVDPTVVEAFTGARPVGLPDARDQLRLIHDRLFPSFTQTG
jgi:5,10-methylenetetrahydromethanopterin reductase